MELVKNAADNIHSQDEIEPELLKELKFYGPKGCPECDNVGYRGRLGLFEIMRITNALRRMITMQATSLEIEKVALESGMVSLEQIGIIKALKGETSLDEVYRVAKRMEDYRSMDSDDTPPVKKVTKKKSAKKPVKPEVEKKVTSEEQKPTEKKVVIKSIEQIESAPVAEPPPQRLDIPAETPPEQPNLE